LEQHLAVGRVALALAIATLLSAVPSATSLAHPVYELILLSHLAVISLVVDRPDDLLIQTRFVLVL
jgi:hypothetical protein